MRTSIRYLIVIVAAMLAAPPGAAAQPGGEATSASKVPVARRLYEEGVEAVGKGRWTVAHDRFKASYELAPRVLTLFNLAGAQAQTGRFIEATESYRRFLRETSDGRYAELRAEATAQLEVMEKQVAQLTLDVVNLDRADVVAIDQVEIPHSALREPFPLNPGPHVATVRRADVEIATRSITLAPGTAESVRIEVPKQVDLTVRAVPGGSPGTGGAPIGDPPPPRRDKGILRSPWFWTAAAVVVVGGATGAYFLTRPDGDVLVVR